ncbi:hypothetical protein N7510_000141 [Penicillium lagena]|uniref:uncharacterized protein n=1 Tax=Penicillium lagena TaxID=94218 RepID=UPI002541EC37|nr:uncharacterized protein N7510_000141 [Penicillium lagena]KAJ5623832.1 hypothetical protein N7510_000141 [Penicillium lagena]
MSGWHTTGPLYPPVMDLPYSVADYDQLGPDPLIADDFPYSLSEGLNSTLTVAQLNYASEFTGNPTGKFQPYPQSYYAAGLVGDYQEGKKTGQSSTMLGHPPSTAPFNNADPTRGYFQPLSQLATERALFMNRLCNQPGFSAYAASPTSDPCSSPGTSHDSSSGWEGDPEREVMDLHSADSSPPKLYPRTPREPIHQYQHMADEDDNLIPLEMPDGSTRFTGNWLPVDPGVGVTIGSCVHRDPSEDGNHLDLQAFHHDTIAFIPPNSAAWSCEG